MPEYHCYGSYQLSVFKRPYSQLWKKGFRNTELFWTLTWCKRKILQEKKEFCVYPKITFMKNSIQRSIQDLKSSNFWSHAFLIRDTQPVLAVLRYMGENTSIIWSVPVSSTQSNTINLKISYWCFIFSAISFFNEKYFTASFLINCQWLFY